MKNQKHAGFLRVNFFQTWQNMLDLLGEARHPEDWMKRNVLVL